MDKTLAVVFGSHFNSYSILQELNISGVREIALIYHDKGLAAYSTIPAKKVRVKNTFESYHEALVDLKSAYTKLVLYPTNDDHTDFFFQYYDRLASFCYIPLNPKTYSQSIDKFNQYKACEEFDVPYPKTFRLSSEQEINSILNAVFPLIIKPVQRDDSKHDIFRNLIINDKGAFDNKKDEIINALKNGFELIVSEIIPGHTNGTIYAYCGFRSPKNGQILNEWTGKKLSQHPNDYGVFSSASNEAPEIVKDQGRQLIENMNLYGFVEPEFKYDTRDGKYKLMEINLRPMMWNRMGYLSGVQLHYTQWLDANDMPNMPNVQIKNRIIHYYYLRHELNNLRRRTGYKPVFKANLFGGEKNYMAVWNLSDIKPFLFDLMVTIKNQFKS